MSTNYESSGTDQWHLTNTAAVTGAPFTIACWAKAESDTTNMFLVWIGDKDTTNQKYGLIMPNTNVASF